VVIGHDDLLPKLSALEDAPIRLVLELLSFVIANHCSGRAAGTALCMPESHCTCPTQAQRLPDRPGNTLQCTAVQRGVAPSLHYDHP
jgi:hypothetical protein